MQKMKQQTNKKTPPQKKQQKKQKNALDTPYSCTYNLSGVC